MEGLSFKDFINSSAGTATISSAGGLVNQLFNRLFGLSKAEKQQNKFNAFQAQQQREWSENLFHQSNAFNAEEAQKTRDFQAEQSATQYQRGVADMQAAGLNPALAYGQGGASAMQGVSASSTTPSGAAASGSGHGIVQSLSDMFQAAMIPEQLNVLRAQREDYLAAAALKRSQAKGQDITNEWMPSRFASELGLTEATIEKYGKEVESIVASTEGQKLANEWNGKLWEQQYKQGEVNRQATIVGISKALQEIENLKAQHENILADTEVKKVTQGLVAAQTALCNVQKRDVSAGVWHKEYVNSFISLYGHAPDEPIWNAITNMLTESGDNIRDVIKNPFGRSNSPVDKWIRKNSFKEHLKNLQYP